jgi:hypothetical protein
MNTKNNPDAQPKILQYPSKRILFASDLHLEFSHPNRFTRQLADYKYDALVIRVVVQFEL